MAKYSRAFVGAVLVAVLAVSALSAETRPQASTPSAEKQQRMEQLGDALRRIQGQPAAPAKTEEAKSAVAKSEKAVNPDSFVTVNVSKEIESHPAFKELMKDLPHAIMNNDGAGKASELLVKEKDLAQLQKSVDSERAQHKNARMDELAASLRAVQNAKIDLSLGAAHVDAAEANEIQPAAPGTPVPTPAQVDAQQLGGSAPAPTPAQNAGLDQKAVAPGAANTAGVYTAAPPANPSAPAPAAPAAGAAPAPAPAPAAPAPAAGAAPAPAGQPLSTPGAPVVPAATPGDNNAQPEPPVKRGDAPADGGAQTDTNAQLSSKMHEIAAKGKEGLTEAGVSSAKDKKPTVTSVEAPEYKGDPLEQRVNLDFREMELTNVVALLATKAGINVIANADLGPPVTVNLKNVPLRQAIETALRINGLGMIEEEGIYRIVPYDEALNTKRVTQLVNLQNAKADDIRKVIDEVLKNSPDERRVAISADTNTNVLVISGPQTRVPELVAMANKLDVTKPVLPTVTDAIKLNYAEPKDVIPTVTAMLSKDVGKVAIDERSRHLVVTDVPVNVENVREMVKTLDMPVRTVAIETMIVDLALTDDEETGVDWVINAVRRQSAREAVKGDNGRFISDLQDLSFKSAVPGGATAGTLTFGLLTGGIDWSATIKAELNNTDSKLMSAPKVLTVENKPATITIAEEIPYIELIQTAAGGQQNKTSFKDIGTLLEVTPRVTHDDHIVTQLKVKESNTNGTFNNVPIESKREMSTSLRTADGQTVFMGGLRKNTDGLTVKKVPVLGDIPVVNVLFRNNHKTDRKNELVVFMTCNVVKDGDELTPYQQDKLETTQDPKLDVNASNELFEYTVHPNETREPLWKYRRTTR